jgi:hypothetical protein
MPLLLCPAGFEDGPLPGWMLESEDYNQTTKSGVGGVACSTVSSPLRLKDGRLQERCQNRCDRCEGKESTKGTTYAL